MTQYLDWVQTGANVVSALGIVAATILARNTIVSARRIARQRSAIDIRLQDEIDTRLSARRRKFVRLCKKGNLDQWAMEENWGSWETQLLCAILNRHEFISSGIHHEIIDEEYYKDLYRSALVDDWIKCSPFVKELRINKANKNLYTELEKLANQWANPQERALLRRMQ